MTKQGTAWICGALFFGGWESAVGKISLDMKKPDNFLGKVVGLCILLQNAVDSRKGVIALLAGFSRGQNCSHYLYSPQPLQNMGFVFLVPQ